MASNIVKEKSFLAAVKVYHFCKLLRTKYNNYEISKQLMRSGTAVGALIREAANAESKRDFVHKFQISQKECDETLYWLEILKTDTELVQEEINMLHNYFEELLKIIKSIQKTTKEKYNIK